MSHFGLNLLGPPEAHLGGSVVEVGRKPMVLLAMLALESGRSEGAALTRDELAQWLWPEKPNPLTNLSTALNQLREQLGQDAFSGDDRKRTVWLNLPVQCDAQAFLEAAHSDEPTLWRDAWASWHGALLEFPDPRWDTKLDQEFQNWLAERRTETFEAHRELGAKLGVHALQGGRWREALEYLGHALPEPGDPREQIGFYAMLLHTALDQPERASPIYQQLSTALHELGAKPSADAEAALEIARAGETSAARALLDELFPPKGEGAEVPFVGRQAEFEVLERELPRSWEGTVRAVLISGEPGAGKTEFARRLIQRLDPRRRGFLNAEGFSERLTPAWRSFDLVVRTLIRSRRRSYDGLSPELKAALSRFLPDILETVGDEAPPGDDRLLLLAIRALLTHDERPTLLFLDDLQWIDEPSLGVVLELLRKPPPRGMLFVGTWRDTELGQADGQTAPNTLARLLEVMHREKCGIELKLGPLETGAVQALAEQLGQGEVDAPWMREQSGGNPLYLLEMFHAAYLHPGAVPPGLEALVLDRINALRDTNTARDVLEACAILGEGAGLSEVKAVSARSYDDTVQALGTLRHARLLLRGETSIHFNHDLTREVTLRHMPLERAQLLHLRAARARSDRPELAATHFWMAMNEGQQPFNSDEMNDVIEVFIRTGTARALRGDLKGGQLWFSRGLELTTNTILRARIFTQHAKVLERLLEYNASSETLAQAELLLEYVDPVTQSMIYNTKSALQSFRFGDPKSAYISAEKSIGIIENIKGPQALSEKANAINFLGVASFLMRDYEKAISFHKNALEIRQALGETEKVGDSLLNLGLISIELNDTSANMYLKNAYDIYVKCGNVLNLAKTISNLGYLSWRNGQIDTAKAYLENAIDLVEVFGDQFILPSVFIHYGAVCFYQKRYEDAITAYQKVLSSNSLLNNDTLRLIALGNIVEAQLYSGLVSSARNTLDNALNIMNHDSDPILVGDLFWYSGEIATFGHHFSEACRCFHKTIDLTVKSDDTQRRYSANIRLARLESDVQIAKMALAFSNSPLSKATLFVASGNWKAAILLSDQIDDRYERGRLLFDIFLLTNNQDVGSAANQILFASTNICTADIGITGR